MVVPVRGELGRLNMISNKENTLCMVTVEPPLSRQNGIKGVAVTWILPVTENNNNNNSNS